MSTRLMTDENFFSRQLPPQDFLFICLLLTFLTPTLFCLRKLPDPFMFYSIPGVHKAEVLGKDVDYSDITALAQEADNDGQPSSDRQEDVEVKVSRSTRISFECHPDVLLEDLLFDNATQDFGQDVLSMIGDDDDFDYLDDIVSMFKFKKPSSKQ